MASGALPRTRNDRTGTTYRVTEGPPSTFCVHTPTPQQNTLHSKVKCQDLKKPNCATEPRRTFQEAVFLVCKGQCSCAGTVATAGGKGDRRGRRRAQPTGVAGEDTPPPGCQLLRGRRCPRARDSAVRPATSAHSGRRPQRRHRGPAPRQRGYGASRPSTSRRAGGHVSSPGRRGGPPRPPSASPESRLRPRGPAGRVHSPWWRMATDSHRQRRRARRAEDGGGCGGRDR